MNATAAPADVRMAFGRAPGVPSHFQSEEIMRVLLCLACVLLAVAPDASAQSAADSWPGGREAAIALTYDDSLRSQVDFALPQLDAAGLKATFFLTGGRMEGEIAAWRAAASAGHELANHAINHPCLRATYSMPDQYASESYSVEVMLAEIRTMNDFLQAIDGRNTPRTFATPCEQNLAGGEDYLAPLQQSGIVSFIRDHRAMPGRDAAPPVYVTSFREGTTGADMIAWAESVRSAGAAGVVVFHGIGGDYLAVPAEAHRALVDYLKARESEIWTATFKDVMTAHAELAR